MTEEDTKAESRKSVPSYDTSSQPWNIDRIRETVSKNDPYFNSAIFVVHGIGEQEWADTAANMRAGFEDVLEKINSKDDGKNFLAPFIREGFWANYAKIEEHFPEDWEKFEDFEKTFYKSVWGLKVKSVFRTYRWFLGQQLRLLWPGVIFNVGFTAWLIYWPLAVASLITLLFAVIRHPKIVTRFLGDVRLYLSPKGKVERAIVNRIDRRVGEAYLRLIGLGWGFGSLDHKKRIKAMGKPIDYKKVCWVAHSLGTVISYNVISLLASRANEVIQNDGVNKDGAELFAKSITGFVTLGSPLDKVAHLYKKSLAPWTGETRKLISGMKTPGWWTNFYSAFDPVSGALGSKLICQEVNPINHHAKSLKSLVPGWSHTSYWEAKGVLRFIIGKNYSDPKLGRFSDWPAPLLTILALIAQIAWVGIMALAAAYILRLAFNIGWWETILAFIGI